MVLYLQGSVHHPPASPLSCLKPLVGEVYSLCFIPCVPSTGAHLPFSWLYSPFRVTPISSQKPLLAFFSRMGSDPYLLTSGLLP